MRKDTEPKIALFIDYDNIAIGLRESGAKGFEAKKIIERLLEKGRIIFKRAYADWNRFPEGKQSLHEAGIELIDIPARRSIGKNSADIRLVVDALDLCYTKEHIDTFVIGSGDSDFSPLVSKLKENDKQVIGFGLRSSTSNLLADNCDEFIFYEELVNLPVSRPPLPPGLTRNQHDAFTLLLEAVAALMRENKDVLWGSLVKDAIRRKRPSFSESQFGYSTFSQLLEDAAGHQLIGLIKDPKSGGTPVVTGYGPYSGTGARRASGAAPTTTRKGSLVVRKDAQPLATADADETAKPVKKRAASSRTRTTTTRKRATSTAKSVKKADESATGETVTPEVVPDGEDTNGKKPRVRKTAVRTTRKRTTAKSGTETDTKKKADSATEDSGNVKTKTAKRATEDESAVLRLAFDDTESGKEASPTKRDTLKTEKTDKTETDAVEKKSGETPPAPAGAGIAEETTVKAEEERKEGEGDGSKVKEKTAVPFLRSKKHIRRR